MAAGRIIIPNSMPALGIDGNPISGAKLTFFANETTTLQAVYTTAALNVAHPNPVSADAGGAFPSIFADTAVAYSVAVTDAVGLPITNLRNRDNVKASVFYGDDVVTDAEAARAAAVVAKEAAEAAVVAATAQVAMAADQVALATDQVALAAAQVALATAQRVLADAAAALADADRVAAAASAAEALVSLGLIGVNQDYEGFLYLLRSLAGRQIIAVEDDATVLAKLALDVGIANGLTITQDPETLRYTFSLGTVEGTLPLASGVTVGVSEYEGYAFLILDPNGYMLEGIEEDGTQRGETIDALSDEVEAARGTAASLTARLDAGLSPEGLPRGLYANTRFLRDWRYKSVGARLATGLCSVAFVGDSWTNYADTASGRNFVQKTTALLQAAFGNGGPGWVPMGRAGGGVSGRPATGRAAEGGVDVSHSGTWSDSPAWAGRGPDLSETTSSTATNTIISTVAATNLTSTKLFYLKKSGGGDFRWRFDSGSWTTVSTANASDLLGVESLTPPTAAHTFTIEVVSGSVTIFGASMTKASGVVVHRLSTSGSTTTHWAATSAVRDASWTALDPDATQILLGTNDQGVALATATYKSNLASLITRRRAGRANADVVLVSVPENLNGRSIPMTSYRDAARACAFENSAVFCDALTAFGETTAEYNTASPRAFITTADDIHPQASGFDELTDVFAGLYISRS